MINSQGAPVASVSAGSGDVLAGADCRLMRQACPGFRIGGLRGVWIHAEAGSRSDRG